ncbi:MAG: ABC-2 family transporter protein, partial [Planctomycetota bacterium]
DRFTSRPHGVYTRWFRRFLVSLLPFALVVSVPSQALFEGYTARVMFHMVGVALGLFLFLLWFWRRGLRAYASASS